MTQKATNDQLIINKNFSKSFIKTTTEFGIKNLEDLLKLSPVQLMDIPNFTFHLLCEYREYLAKNGLDTK
jgi:hypothetical protein